MKRQKPAPDIVHVPPKTLLRDPKLRRDLLARITALDAMLVKSGKGWHALPPWWIATFRAFVFSLRRQLVLRVGRRGGKSSSLCRFAVAYALWAATLGLVGPGDIGFVVFVSTSREEAAQRLATITQILRALGIEPRIDGDALVLDDLRVGFKVLTCSLAGVSGWTSILIIADEVALWFDKATGANPATAVLAQLRPTGATTRAPIVLSSSAWTDVDPHARAFAEGDTKFQMVAEAQSWVANPTLTEQELREEEPDERAFLRHYGNVPQPALLDGFLADCTRQCVDGGRKSGAPRNGLSLIVSIDPAWRSDEFVCSVLSVDANEHGLPIVTVEEVAGWQPKPGRPLKVEQTVERVSEICARWGVSCVYSDQKDEDTLAVLFRQNGIDFIGVPWTGVNKPSKFRFVRSLMLDGRLRLIDDPATIGQFESIAVVAAPGGAETYQARGADDRVSAIVLGAYEAATEAPMPRRPGDPPLISNVSGCGTRYVGLGRPDDSDDDGTGRGFGDFC